MEADPNKVEFVWEFNNSGENFEVAPAKFDDNNGTTSELIYTPVSERDYGALTCWGRNAIGKQEAPCIYQIIPAGNLWNIFVNILWNFIIYIKFILNTYEISY